MRTITPQPGFSENDVKTILATREFIYADLFTFVTKFNDVLRYCSTENDVTVFPPDLPSSVFKQSWVSNELKVKGLRLKSGVGVEVDEQECTFDYGPKLKYRGLLMQDALRLGRFDGTTIRRDRVIAQHWGTPDTPTVWAGSVQMFSGRLSAVDSIARASANVKVKSDLLLLNVQMPKNLFQPSCVHTLFDPGCTLNRIDFEQIGNTEVGSTAGMIIWSGATPGLALGRIDFEDGSGVSEIRTIRKVDGDKIYLAYPLNFEPNEGMLFKAYPGCNRALATCTDKFNNKPHFKGFPYVPVSETAY